MSKRFEGRAAVITGAASGMGLLCSQRLAAEGANVTILDEREEITFLTGGTLRLPRRKGWGLSVFSLTDRCTGVCLRGVKYRLEDAVLTNRVPLGVSNEFAAPEAEISLTQGILMIAQTKK